MNDENWREISFKLSNTCGPNNEERHEFQFTKYNNEEGFSLHAYRHIKDKRGRMIEDNDPVSIHLTHKDARLLIEFLQRGIDMPVEEP